ALAGGVTNTYEILQVTKAPRSDAAIYDPSPRLPANTHFSDTVPPSIEVRRAPTGHVLVHPRFGGLDLGWLIFDTGAGASTILDPSAMAKLNVTPLGAAPVTSFLGPTRTRIARGPSIELGPVTLTKPLLVEMDLGFVRQALGKEVVGIIGFDLLSRCV